MARLIKIFKVIAISSLVLNAAPFVYDPADGNAAFAKNDKSKEKSSKNKSKERGSSKKSNSSDKASKGNSSKSAGSDKASSKKKDKAPKRKKSATKASDKAKGGAVSSAAANKSSDDKSSKSYSKKTLLDLFRKPSKETVVEPKPVKTVKPKAKAKTKPQPKKVKKASTAASKKVTPAKKANPKIALGALSAAQVSERALMNADPESQVGKIAAYKKKVLLAETLRADILKTKNEMEAGLQSHMTLSEHAYVFAAETTKMNAIENEIAEIVTALNAVGGVNDELEADLKDAEKLLIAQINTLLDLERREAALQRYWSAWDNLAVRQKTLDLLDAEAWQMLEDAADKPLTVEVVAEVHRLLGLPTFEIDVNEGENLTMLLD